MKAEAQFYYFNRKYYDQPVIIEAGFQAGYMNCLTDLGGNKGRGKGFIKDLNPEAGKANAGVFLGMKLERKYGLRLNFTKGKTGGADSLIRNYSSEAILRKNRNLHFQSSITEVSMFFEIYFLNIFSKEDKMGMLSPYIGAGAGVFKFNPRAILNGSWVDLSYYRTEGQGLQLNSYNPHYKLVQLNIPVGGGILFEPGAKWNIRLEVQHRKLFTDYLDDVSTRYVNPSIFHDYFIPRDAEIATELYDRRKDKSYNATGHIRGGKGNDSYFTINILASFIINRKAIN